MNDDHFAGPAGASSFRAKLVSFGMCVGFAVIAVKAGLVALSGQPANAGVSEVFETKQRRADIIDRHGEHLGSCLGRRRHCSRLPGHGRRGADGGPVRQ